jgi:hypothetical protein
MDPLIIILIALAVIAVSGWGYGTYAVGPPQGASTTVVSGPAWANPLGIIGLVVVVGVIVMLTTGWRPFVIVAQ